MIDNGIKNENNSVASGEQDTNKEIDSATIEKGLKIASMTSFLLINGLVLLEFLLKGFNYPGLIALVLVELILALSTTREKFASWSNYAEYLSLMIVLDLIAFGVMRWEILANSVSTFGEFTFQGWHAVVGTIIIVIGYIILFKSTAGVSKTNETYKQYVPIWFSLEVISVGIGMIFFLNVEETIFDVKNVSFLFIFLLLNTLWCAIVGISDYCNTKKREMNKWLSAALVSTLIVILIAKGECFVVPTLNFFQGLGLFSVEYLAKFSVFIAVLLIVSGAWQYFGAAGLGKSSTDATVLVGIGEFIILIRTMFLHPFSQSLLWMFAFTLIFLSFLYRKIDYDPQGFKRFLDNAVALNIIFVFIIITLRLFGSGQSFYSTALIITLLVLWSKYKANRYFISEIKWKENKTYIGIMIWLAFMAALWIYAYRYNIGVYISLLAVTILAIVGLLFAFWERPNMKDYLYKWKAAPVIGFLILIMIISFKQGVDIEFKSLDASGEIEITMEADGDSNAIEEAYYYWPNELMSGYIWNEVNSPDVPKQPLTEKTQKVKIGGPCLCVFAKDKYGNWTKRTYYYPYRLANFAQTLQENPFIQSFTQE